MYIGMFRSHHYYLPLLRKYFRIVTMHDSSHDHEVHNDISFNVPTKGCLLCVSVCVCVPTSKLVTVRGYCSLLVLCLFSSTWCTPHKQGPSGAHKEDMVCHICHHT